MVYYLGNLPLSPELRHHGIKGQKWGVQNGPPYPLDKETIKRAYKEHKRGERKAKRFRPSNLREQHTIPAGTTMYRMTTNPNENPAGHKYVSMYDADRQHYRAGWVRKSQGSDKVYENTYILQKPVKVPSREELYSVINDVVDRDKDKHVATITDRFARATIPGWNEIKDLPYKELDGTTEKYGERITRALSKLYNSATVSDAKAYTAAVTFGTNDDLRESVFKELKKRGYNAMVDEASVGGQTTITGLKLGREGVEPLIIFDGSGVLQKTGTKEVSRDEEEQAGAKYNKWTAKMRQRKREAAWSVL